MIIYYYIGNKSSQFMIFGARKFPQTLDYVHKLQVWVSQLLIRQFIKNISLNSQYDLLGNIANFSKSSRIKDFQKINTKLSISVDSA